MRALMLPPRGVELGADGPGDARRAQTGPVLVTDHPRPEPVAGEALIRPLRVGVCATDLELVRDDLGFTGVLGHEFVGEVVSVNAAADRGWVGRRVVGDINAACHRCDTCEAGMPGHCPHRTVLGIRGRDGCFADGFVLPVRNLHPVPPRISDEAAVFAEPLAAAVQVARQLPMRPGDRVTVLGDGRLGLLVAQVLHTLNPAVRLLGRHPAKLAKAERWGIATRPVEEVQPRHDQDAVVDCTGSPTGISTAFGLLRPRGRLVLKTTPTPRADGVGLDWSPLVTYEYTLIGSRCGPLPDALRLLEQGRVDVLSLVTHRMRLGDGVKLLQTAARHDAIKVVARL